MLKFDEKIEKNRFNTILKFNFLFLYSSFKISEGQGKPLSRSRSIVPYLEQKNANLSKKFKIRAFVFFLFEILTIILLNNDVF